MKFFRLLLVSFCLFVMGCSHLELKNVTPAVMPVNESGMYSLELKTQLRDGDVIRENFRPLVIIDGEEHLMRAKGRDHYAYDWKAGSETSISYFFNVCYSIRDEATGLRQISKRTDEYHLRISSRNVLGLSSERAKPGSKISVMGKGFSRDCQIYFNDQPVLTTFLSPQALSFRVPTIPSACKYRVDVVCGDEKTKAGEIWVDSGDISASPSTLTVSVGGRAHANLNFSSPAPDGDLPIEVTTNIPSALSMEDVVLRSGRRSLSFFVDGIEEASGKLFIKAPGFNPLTIYVHVLP